MWIPLAATALFDKQRKSTHEWNFMCGHCHRVFPTHEVLESHLETCENPLKPPLGVMPETIWQEKKNDERVRDLRAAMKRYLDDDKPIPSEWLDELKRRT